MIRIINLLGSSSIPGISNIINNKSLIIKLIWLVCLLALIGLCGWFLVDTINSYLDYEVVTNIDVIREDMVQFPTVTFCVPKPINKTLNLKEFLFVCFYDLVECNLDEDFEYYENELKTQACYRFNSDKMINKNNKTTIIKTATRPDSMAGLLVFYLVNGFIESPLNLNFSTPAKSTLYIQNHSAIFQVIKPYNIETGLLLANGVTFVPIEREIVQKLPQPYNQCVKQDTNEYVSNLFQYFIKKNKTYLQKDCFDFCVEEIILKECNCSQSIGEIVKCYNDYKDTKGSCIIKKGIQYRTKSLSLPDICKEKCPVECDSIVFRKSQNYLGVPSDDFFKILNFNQTVRSNFEKNGVCFVVYYQSLDYTLINQIPKMKLFDLVSNLGGTLGLFIGLSFISFVEFIEIGLKLISFYF